MDKYLKMADVFDCCVDSDSALMLGDSICNAADLKHCIYAAHAINSHDELVAEVERLRMLELGVIQLERLKNACVNMGIATPESIEDLGIAQHHYIRMLIESAINM